MNVVGSIIGASVGINLINGKIKPKKKGIFTYVVLIILFLLLLLCSYFLIMAIIDLDIEFMLYMGILIWAIGYVLLVSPYTQNSNNYYIIAKNSNSFIGFELFYKQKKVELKYLVDEEGKFKFANNDAKLECISYSDGTKMSNFTKYKILNYFGEWLISNDYMSKDVTTTFEEL